MKGINPDVFATLLLVFLASTGLLLRNQSDPSSSGSKPEAQKQLEQRTPKIELPTDAEPGRSLEVPQGALSVSARMGEQGQIEYYVRDARIPLQDLWKKIKDQGATAVELRIDERLTHNIVIKILGQCRKAGVDAIYYVYIQQ